MAPSVPNSRTYFYPIPLNANCDRCCNLSGLDSSERSGRTEWKANIVPNPMSRMEVAINRTFDEDQTQQSSQNGSLAYIEGQLCEKPSTGRRRQQSQHRPDESAEDNVEFQTQSIMMTEFNGTSGFLPCT